MFVLKDFQKRTLDTLEMYFKECAATNDASTSFYKITGQIFGRNIPYLPVQELPGLPYICIRIPTGGGKTVVACHSVNIAARELVQQDYPVVLWLVPSNAIKEQTLNAFKDLSHPYRQALASFGKDITVLDVREALYVQSSTLNTNITIIISTMQAFRVEDIDGRKVYDNNGALSNHFSQAPREALENLEKREDGSVSHSLANILRIRRPIVIVDEAHNARTDLSFETLARFKPACIIEFTATPSAKQGNASNVLHTVSAMELNAESMIKLPIMLETRENWEELLQDAVGMLSRLAEYSREEKKTTGEYLRPIMLLQAQPTYSDKESITVEILKEKLLTDHKIPEEEIAIATGTQKELDGIDILDPECPIKYVITIQALKEGWDCPFAYILCSVAELKSSTAVEQILGRVMRLPNVKKKENKPLNKAYAFVASNNFFDTAKSLTSALIENGFEKQEAEEFIKSYAELTQSKDGKKLGLATGSITILLEEKPNIIGLSERTASKVRYDPGANMITFFTGMDEIMRDELKKCFSTEMGKDAIDVMYDRLHGLPLDVKASPAETGADLSIPVLSILIGTTLEQFEASHFLDRPWKLSDNPAELSEEEYDSTRPEGRVGELTMGEDGRVQTRFLKDLHYQMTLISDKSGWTIPRLVYWLDHSICHPDISSEDSGIYLTVLVNFLIEERGLSLDDLVYDKYRLRNAVDKKINEYREKAAEESYQSVLIKPDETNIIVKPENSFRYDPESYPCSRTYTGNYDFKKHYYNQVGDLGEIGEEFDCAQYIDTLDEVEYWVRNIERRINDSFWLQTKTDKFYPDFVCKLKDGRFLVVEHKGEHLYTNEDSKEKRALGELWEERSEGECLFIMTNGRNFEIIRSKIVIKI